jgi:uncharacterized SAM-binding protein YcdF (DUF218 family)
MDVAKHLVGVLAMPLAAAFLLGLAAGVLRLCGRKRVSAAIVVAAGLIGYLGSVSVVGDALLAPLERRYPPLPHGALPAGVRFVMVLGSGYVPRDDIPVTAALAEDGLVRIVEGISIVRRLDSARLVASGGAPPGFTPSARGYAELASQLGVDSKSLVVLDTPLDTAEEAESAVRVIGEAPFILVTSAYHMPRAMRLMERAGLHPIPAPTGYAESGPPEMDWRRVVPSGTGARKTERALHEYLGLAAIRLGVE